MPLLGELKVIDGETHVWCGRGWIAACYSDLVYWPVEMKEKPASDAANLRTLLHGVLNGDQKIEAKARELLYGKPIKENE